MVIIEAIDIIIEQNNELFGKNPIVEKINVGFTNLIFSINKKFIVKICNNLKNEENFRKEVNFYRLNGENHLIPKLYYFNIDKKDVPFYYEIIEKIEGTSLYNVWHNFNEEQREEIIRQLCDAMKAFHSNIGEKIDWIRENKEKFLKLFEQANAMNLFNDSEKELLMEAYSLFDMYLQSEEFVLVHNDLHFDNIIYSNGSIKLIDFERSCYAPKDFELDILYRMIGKPWKFASEEAEKNIKIKDYENIMAYIERYYPELMQTKYLFKRLAIYDLLYYLKQYIEYPHIDELKEDILNATIAIRIGDVH